MARHARTLRLAVLLAVAALGLHQLRYLIAFGGGAGSALSREGHAYLSLLVVPALGLALAVVLAQALICFAGGAPAEATPAAVRLRRVWPAASAAMLGIYASQELLEGALATGHLAGAAGVVGGGGWVAVPLAIVLGALVALALRIARAVEVTRAAPALALPLTRLHAAPRWVAVAYADFGRRGRELAEHLAGRGPPVVCR